MNTQTAVASINMPVLQKGNSGEAVRFLQQVLILRYGYQLRFDAQFGATTENVVKLFQRDYGLIPDGIVGKNTWRALSENIAR